MKKKSLTDVVWVIAANGFSSLFQFLLIISITKEFGVESVGLYSSATALILPIITFIMGLNLAGIQLTDVDEKYTLSDYFVVRAFGAVLTFVLIFIISSIKETNYYIVSITIVLLLRYISDLFSEIINNEMIKKGKYNKYAFSIISRAVVSYLFFYICSLYTQNFSLSLFAYSIAWLLIFLIVDLRNIEVGKLLSNFDVDFKVLSNLIIACLPLAIVATINTLYDSIPRYFIEYYVGLEGLGVFSATLYFSLIGGLFVAGVTLTFSNKLAHLNKENAYNSFLRIVAIQEAFIITICVILFLLFYTIGEEILVVLFTEDFKDYLDVVLLLIAAMSFNFTSKVLGAATTAVGLNKSQVNVALICILVLTTTAWILIPKYQLYGAGISLLVTYFVKNILLVLILNKKVKFKYLIQKK